MEIPRQKHRDRRERLIECFGTEVRSGRELADVERQFAHHPAISSDLRLYIDVVETQPIHGDGAAEERQRATVCPDGGRKRQRGRGHSMLPPVLVLIFSDGGHGLHVTLSDRTQSLGRYTHPIALAEHYYVCFSVGISGFSTCRPSNVPTSN